MANSGMLTAVLALCLVATASVIAQDRQQKRCADDMKMCPTWALRGECYHNGAFMYAHCPDSCGQCDVEDPTCFNADKMCTGWAKLGECRKNKPYMERMCSRACAFCTPANDHSVPHVRSNVVARFWNDWSKQRNNLV